MKTLILTCSTGGGHNTCATAIKEELTRRGELCDVEDSLSFVSRKLSALLSWGHSTMYRHFPGLFRVGYHYAEKHPEILERGTVLNELLTGNTEPLYRHINDGGYDTVICVHVFAALLMARVRQEYSLLVQTAFVATDYTCSPGAAEAALDFYFIPDDSLLSEFAKKGVEKEKIYCCGIPIRCAAGAHREKAEAKRLLGIEPTMPHLLVMCGSMGCGPLKKLTKELTCILGDGCEVTVVCGTNKKLYKKLRRRYCSKETVHIFGFTDNIAQLLDSADLYLTKPGGLSTTEAAIRKVPMVLVDAVSGCEMYNLQYFTALGGAKTADSPHDLARLCADLLQCGEAREKMAEALTEEGKKNASAYICSNLQCRKRGRGQ